MSRGDADVAVIGAGFGGLGAALSLAERGARVVLFESLKYPGGCASTYTRRGARYESGATLFSGFAPGQLFHHWIQRHALDVQIDFLDPVVTFRAGGPRPFVYEVPATRPEHVERFASMASSPDEAARVRALFAEQERVADTLWELFASPGLLPPFGGRELFAHLARVPAYLPLLRWVGRPLRDLLAKYRLEGYVPLRVFLDGVSQITVQAGVEDAEAPFAMATMDYFFRGTGHVHGGIGQLATQLVEAIRRKGADVRMPDRVQRLERNGGGWVVHSRRGSVRVDTVIANMLPQDVDALLPVDVTPRGRLAELAEAVETGWGAAMLYYVLDPAQLEGVGAAAHHFELVADPRLPLLEGNHIFCSLSAADEEREREGGRTMTVSTHVPMVDRADPATYIARVQSRMRATLAELAPQLAAAARSEMPGSPRTFARFTGRHRGFVGGIPRRAGWQNYRHLWPAPVADDLYLVGDTVFPGQSTLATAIGGVKLADHLARRRSFASSPRASSPRASSPRASSPRASSPRAAE